MRNTTPSLSAVISIKLVPLPGLLIPQFAPFGDDGGLRKSCMSNRATLAQGLETLKYIKKSPHPYVAEGRLRMSTFQPGQGENSINFSLTQISLKIYKTVK